MKTKHQQCDPDRSPRMANHHDDFSRHEWLDLDQASKYLNKTPRFMRRLVAERRIVHYKHRSLLAFRKRDLDSWATSERREALR